MTEAEEESVALRVSENGAATYSDFLKWLEPFMCNGSDQKVFRCGWVAYNAILSTDGLGGMRKLPQNEMHNFATPFGRILLRHDPSLKMGEIITEDHGDLSPNLREKSESAANNLMGILM